MVLRKVKDQPTTVTTRATEVCGNGDEREEHKMNPTVDLSDRAKETHRSWRRAEVAAVNLVRIRVMQQPEPVKTRSSTVAAAELEQ